LRSVRVLWNVVTNYLRLILAAGIGFLLTPFMVHHLGDRNYGLWVTVFSLTGYFGLFDQGIRPSLVRYVSRDHAAGDHEGLARTINSAIALYGGVGVLTMLVASIVAANAHAWIRVDPALLGVAPTLVLLLGATLALGFPLGVFGAVLSGLQRYDIANGIGMVVGVLRLVAFMGVLKLGGGLVALAWTSLVVNLFGHAWSWLAARRLLPGLPIGPRWVRRATLRLIAGYGTWALVGALATNIAFQTDALVITAFLGAALATPFALASGLVETSRSLVHAAAWVLSPTASEMDTLGEGEKLRSMLVAGSKYSVLVSWPVLLGLVIFGRNLLHTWVGERYAWASLLLTVLAVPTLVALPQATASSVLFGISRHRGVVVLSLSAAVANLGLSVWWARSPGLMRALFGDAVPAGLVGVAMGTAVPLFLISGIASAWYACAVLEEPFARYLWQGLLQPGLVSMAFVVPAVFVQRMWHPLGWLPLFAACFGCWLVFVAVAWGVGISGADRARWGAMLGGLLGRARAAGEAGG
jgi:O-antigen/teichoic acid export membrane protein